MAKQLKLESFKLPVEEKLCKGSDKNDNRLEVWETFTERVAQNSFTHLKVSPVGKKTNKPRSTIHTVVDNDVLVESVKKTQNLVNCLQNMVLQISPATDNSVNLALWTGAVE